MLLRDGVRLLRQELLVLEVGRGGHLRGRGHGQSPGAGRRGHGQGPWARVGGPGHGHGHRHGPGAGHARHGGSGRGHGPGGGGGVGSGTVRVAPFPGLPVQVVLEHLLHQGLQAVRVDAQQHLRVLLVEVSDVHQLHQQLGVQDPHHVRRVLGLQVAQQKEGVALLLLGDVQFIRDGRAVRGVQRDHQQQDQHRLVRLQVQGQRLDELHVILEEPHAAHVPHVSRVHRGGIGGDLELLGGHGVLLLVVRVQELLLVLVEGDDGADDEQLYAATLQEPDLVGLRQRLERLDLLGHVDDAPHADLRDVDHVDHGRLLARNV